MPRMPRRRVLQMRAFAVGFSPLRGAARSRSGPTPDDGAGGSPVRIEVVQQETVPGAIEANRDKAMAFAKQALENRADVDRPSVGGGSPQACRTSGSAWRTGFALPLRVNKMDTEVIGKAKRSLYRALP